jgi:hypothetical protein
MLKHQNGRALLLRKVDNAAGSQMGKLLISMANLAPEISVVLFTFVNDARLLAVACDTS